MILIIKHHKSASQARSFPEDRRGPESSREAPLLLYVSVLLRSVCVSEQAEVHMVLTL